MRVAEVLDDLRSAGIVAEVRAGIDASPATDHQLDAELIDATHDSRQAAPGVLFCAVPGATFDGHDFVPSAIDAGSTTLLVDRWLDVSATQIRVADVRAAMPIAAANVHGKPSRELAVFGITGTNGKTTTTNLLASVMRTIGRNVAVIGTLSGVHTTPEATDFQRRLRQAVVDGVDVVAAEISSHALEQHRADAIEFAVAAFSNLTPDHLDYHDTMESYFEAKARLFDGRATHELINIDDEWGARLAARRADARQLSMNDVEIVEANATGTVFAWRSQRVHLPIPGDMNVANALMAAEAARLLGADATEIAAALAQSPQVPGRMERVEADASVTAIVDYSHTPDSIERALATIRNSSPDAAVTIVFGCGGDRDRAKRPLMGQAAEAGADLVIVTSDNPRSEDPTAIIDEAIAGMANPAAALVEVDRRAAIALAIEHTPAGGVILIAGKGHERTQTIGDQVLPFDDVAVAQELLGASA